MFPVPLVWRTKSHAFYERSPSNLLENLESSWQQWKEATHTGPNVDELVSHEVIYKKNTGIELPKGVAGLQMLFSTNLIPQFTNHLRPNGFFGPIKKDSPELWEGEIAERGAFDTNSFTGPLRAEQIALYNFWAQQAKNASKPTPYWVVRVPKGIVEGHNDIFSERFYAVLTGLMRLSGSFPMISPVDPSSQTKKL